MVTLKYASVPGKHRVTGQYPYIEARHVAMGVQHRYQSRCRQQKGQTISKTIVVIDRSHKNDQQHKAEQQTVPGGQHVELAAGEYQVTPAVWRWELAQAPREWARTV